jgi:DNA-binding transcriptional ArsR family regulator
MSNRKDHELTGNLYRVYKTLPQSRAKGIHADEIADELNIDRATVYSHLSTLKHMGRAESEQGSWSAKTGEQTNKDLEKEIMIELPMPKGEWRRIAFLEAQAKEFERLKIPLAEDIRILLEKFRETRTIKIKGKNVDDIDLEKAANFIRQANEKSSKVSLRGLFKSLKKQKV